MRLTSVWLSTLPLLLAACTLATPPMGSSITQLPLEQAATATPVEETGTVTDTATLTDTMEMTHTAGTTETTDLTDTEGLTDTAEMNDTAGMTDSAEMTDTMEMTGGMEMTGTAPLTATVFPTSASVELQDVDGNVVGTATLTETDAVVAIRVEVTGFTAATPGEHGIHFHQVGRCTPDFAVAGEHFNPTMDKHGFDNPEGFHVGDLPNITIDDQGNGLLELNDDTITLSNGERSLLAADGTALVIHANPDDYFTDPSGRSGARIACGVVVAEGVGEQPAPEVPPAVTGNNVQPERRSPTPDRIAQLQPSEGFTVTVFARDLASIRMMAQAEDGTIYVTRRGQGDVLALRDDDGDGQADDPPITATAGLTSVHGIIISGTQVYLAVPTTIYVGTLVGDGTIADLFPYATGLPEGGQHGNRTMAFGPDGLLYVSVGSSCNACNETNPEHATIVQIQPDGSHTIFARGLRNTIGWGWHPQTGQLWGMDHGSDWRGDEQPPEELNLIEQDNNYGWPFCFADQQIDRYIPTQPQGMTKAEFCALSTGPVLTYTAHSAPIGMIFYTGDAFGEEYVNDAFVAMRGSWNRQEPVGYKVVRLDFDENGQPVGFEDFLTGFLIEDGAAQFGRVAGLLQLPDGSLLVSDDTNGMIYRIAPLAEEAAQ
jgi:glucose/arabinose dehydrogenase/Cu/Zn superoxide dismutase